uniref:Ig-like domain-containing protein n=1 Tax=Xiphophorus couchianus TaxID=32473 RepID=A0A3B5MFP9_9TELE
MLQGAKGQSVNSFIAPKSSPLFLLSSFDVTSVEVDTPLSVKHSLRYFLTATYGVQDFPEFVGAATVDEVQVGYCDSNIKTAKPKQDWMRKLIERNPEHLEWYSQKCLGSQHVFRANIDDLKRRLNLTEGPHILQRMNGCEWDDETGEITGFNQYGYNGEDFLALDLKTLTWIAPKSQAVLTKLIWDAKKARLEHNKNYYIYKCPDWLKNYIRHGKSFLQRTESPSISLLQKTPSSVVSCHATGFFPDRAEMFWRKDGEEIHEDVEKGEILLNNDGTFQMSVELNVSSVPPDSWKQYDCVFQLSGVGDDIKITLDKSVIRTNWGKTHLCDGTLTALYVHESEKGDCAISGSSANVIQLVNLNSTVLLSLSLLLPPFNA